MNRRVLSFIALFCMFFVTCNLNVSAYYFDAAYYAKKYPDVVQALGSDPAVLYDHYIKNGAAEGRFQCQAEESDAFAQTLSGGGTYQAKAETVSAPKTAGNATYIDVNLAAQTVTYYENGEVKLSTPCVTGNVGAGNGTPAGNYAIAGEVPGKFLKGPTWNVWVDRWMPFNGNIGFHDASWRASFGGEIYQTNGSHGCVNLPKDAAYALYDMISVGTPVTVH